MLFIFFCSMYSNAYIFRKCLSLVRMPIAIRRHIHTLLPIASHSFFRFSSALQFVNAPVCMYDKEEDDILITSALRQHISQSSNALPCDRVVCDDFVSLLLAIHRSVYVYMYKSIFK